MRVSVLSLLAAAAVAAASANPEPLELVEEAYFKRAHHNGVASRRRDVSIPVKEEVEEWGADAEDVNPWEEDAPTEADDDDAFDPEDTGVSPALEVRAPKTKACLAWTNEVAKGLKSFSNKGVFGMYTWSEWCPTDAKKFGIPCFPMLWGDKNRDKFKKTAVKGYAQYALGMNEVNIKGQSTMSPGKAAWMWRTYMMPLQSKGYKLISPATANGKTAPAWMKEFFKTCPECKKSTHAVAAHYYGTDPKKFIDYMTDLHKQLGNATLWVTEIGCQNYSGKGGQCTQQMADNYLNTVISWMEKTPWVETYCWYGMFHTSRVGVSSVNGMFNADGTINRFGKMYLAKSGAPV